MAFVVTENCAKCKYTDCVAACPVDCFYELDNMLVIDPIGCIDCYQCIPTCPVEAIYEASEVPKHLKGWIEFNAVKSAELIEVGIESLIEPIDPLPTAEAKRKSLGF